MKTRKPIEKRILKARTQMLFEFPFFGQLLMRLRFIDGSKWLPTAATDGVHLYFNEEFLNTLDDEELYFVFSHELLHCVYQHVGPMSRLGERNPKLWNFAGDYIINQELKDTGVGKIPNIPLLLDDQFSGMHTERVYDILFEKNEANKEKFKKMIGEGNFDHHMDSGGSMSDGKGEDTDQNNKPCDANGLPIVLDGSDLDELAEKYGFDATGETGPIPMTEDQAERLGNEWRDATQNAARSTDAGNLPGGVKRLLKDLEAPKMDWRELINATLRSLIKSDYSFMRPSRKTWGGDVFLPGMTNEDEIDVCVCIDTSGSISDGMLRDFLSEVQGIMEEFQTFKLKLWFFDTKAYTIHEFSSENISDLSSTDLKIEGGGGTDFVCNWKLMKRNDINPAQLIMFTDGYPCGDWGDPDYCDTLFVVWGNDNIVAPFGQTAYYKR